MESATAYRMTLDLAVKERLFIMRETVKWYRAQAADLAAEPLPLDHTAGVFGRAADELEARISDYLLQLEGAGYDVTGV